MTPPLTPLPLGGCLLLTHLRPKPTCLLPLRVLPAADLLQAHRVLAIPLIPTPRLVDAPATLAQTNAWPQPTRAGRNRTRGGTLAVSHGRVHSQWGRPSGSPKPLGHSLSGHSGSGPHRLVLPPHVSPEINPFSTSRLHAELAEKTIEENREGHFLSFLPPGRTRTPKETEGDARRQKKNRRKRQKETPTAARQHPATAPR